MKVFTAGMFVALCLITAASQVQADPSQFNLLELSNCGKDSYGVGTPEESKRFLNQYPWLAILENFNLNTRVMEEVCHGVLIHPSFVVTAAHCVGRKRESNLRCIRLNDYRLDTLNDVLEVNGESVQTTVELISVKNITVHPNYNRLKYTYDIALVMLEHSTRATPICLPPIGSSLATDLNLFVIGWKRNTRPEKPMNRNKANLTDLYSCKQRYDEIGFSLNTSGAQACSKYSFDDDSNSCSHYIGSAPHVYSKVYANRESRYFLAAIHSFGQVSCNRDDYPRVVTNIAYYGDWIRESIEESLTLHEIET